MARSRMLLDIEWLVIQALSEQGASRPDGVHGYELADILVQAKEATAPIAAAGRTGQARGGELLACPGDARALRANGTIYKVLFRLNRCGAIESRWEEAEVALDEGRPRRRYWVLTENGRARAANLTMALRLRRHFRRIEAETHAAYRG